jgi:hypothetical protein
MSMAARPATARAPKPALLTAAALVTWTGPLAVVLGMVTVPVLVVKLGVGAGVMTGAGVVVSGTKLVV